MTRTITVDDIPGAIGTEIGRSEWRAVTQEMINLFADATDDHQWIHVDPERAARETPFGGSIAHGFLTLSLLSRMSFDGVAPLEGVVMGVNYGFDKVRFLAPVPSGARVRARFKLLAAEDKGGGRWLQASPPLSRSTGSRRPSCPRTARPCTRLTKLPSALGRGNSSA